MNAGLTTKALLQQVLNDNAGVFALGELSLTGTLGPADAEWKRLLDIHEEEYLATKRVMKCTKVREFFARYV
jgi:hypothetical protein